MEMDKIKQAVLILWHINEKNLRRLINFFDDDDFDIFIHVDRKKMIPKFLTEMQISRRNIMVINKVRITWGGLSIVKAELALFESACQHDKYSYLHLISGTDYPIKSLADFKRFFKDSDKEYVEYSEYPVPKWNNGGMDRLRFFWPMDIPLFKWDKNSNRIIRFVNLQKKFGIDRKNFTKSIHPYGGSNWISITGDCAAYILSNKTGKCVLKKLRHTFAPDESYFQTVIMNSPYKRKTVCNNLRFIDWGKGLPSPSTLSGLHVKAALRSGCFFARKIKEDISEPFIDVITKYLSEGNISHPTRMDTCLRPQMAHDIGRINIYFIQTHDEHINGVHIYEQLLEKIYRGNDIFNFTRLIFLSPNDGMTYENDIMTIQTQLPPKEGIEYLSSFDVISKVGKNIFFHNFCPASPTICAIRNSFPESKIIYVIHDFIWLSLFNGNVEAYIEFIKTGETPLHLKNRKQLLQALFHDVRNAAESSDIVLCHNEDTEFLLNDFFGVKREFVKMIKIGLPDTSDDLIRASGESTCRDNHTLALNNKGSNVFLTALGCPADVRKFLYGGRITDQKGFDTLVQAAKMLLECNYNFRIIAVGDSSTYKRQIPFNIIPAGELGRQSLLKLMEEVDFRIIASRFEQCGIIGIEMKRAGLPVIASDSFGVRQMFNQKNSLTFKTGNYRELADRMKQALDMPYEEIKKCSRMSRNDFISRFHFSDMEKKYIELARSFFHISGK